MVQARRALFMVLALMGLVLVGPVSPAHAADPPATPGQTTFVPVAPVRLLDTRSGTAVGPGQYVDLNVSSLGTNARSVVLNVTAALASTTTVIRVFPTPTGSTVPTVSNVNVVRNVTVAGLVVSRIGVNRSVRLHNTSGTVHLIADLSGYYIESGAGAGFTGIKPIRLLDTRTLRQPLEAGVPRTLDVRIAANGAASGVPADAVAVILNVTALGPTASTYLTLYPSGTPPTASNLSARRGQVIANLVVVKVDAGLLRLLNFAGTTHVAVDLAGWFTPTGGAVFHAVDPFRALDTRTNNAPVLAGAPRGLALAGIRQIPWHATALALTVTATQATAATYVTAYPAAASTTPPTASNLNVLRGQVVSNAAVVAPGRGGAIMLSNAVQQVHLLVDVAGWFGPRGDGWDISWPQCAASGSTQTATLPTTGAFAVVGLTHGPFRANSCFAAEWAWASGLPGVPSTYINLDAPKDSARWAAGRYSGPLDGCLLRAESVACGYNYGWALAGYVLPRLPVTPDGGKPMVWLDVEGPYTNGPFWTSDVNANRAVIQAVRSRLHGGGYRVGIYSDRATSSFPDWQHITGGYRLTSVQNWVFRAPDANAAALCRPDESFSGGPVVMVQVQPGQSGQPFDVNHAC